MQPNPEQNPLSHELANQAPDLHAQAIHRLANDALAASEAAEDPAQIEVLSRTANVLFDNAETTAAVNPQDLAQEVLETYQPDGMGEESRKLAVWLNQSARSEKGLPPLSFEAALTELADQANSNLTIDDEKIKQEGVSMGFYTRSASREPTIDVCNSMLTMLESNLSDWAKSPDKTPLHNEQVEAWRAQRDAIWRKRSELTATQQIAKREAAEQPVHDAAVKEAQAKVEAVITVEQPLPTETPQQAPEISSQTMDVTRQLGETWARLSRYVPDKQFSAFAGYKELPAEQQQALASELWGMYREATAYKGDIRQRGSDMAEKFDALAAKYAAIEKSHARPESTSEQVQPANNETSTKPTPTVEVLNSINATEQEVDNSVIETKGQHVPVPPTVKPAMEAPALPAQTTAKHSQEHLVTQQIEAQPPFKDSDIAKNYLNLLMANNGPVITSALQEIAASRKMPYADAVQLFREKLVGDINPSAANSFVEQIRAANLSPNSVLWRENPNGRSVTQQTARARLLECE